ncbi:MAG: formimidoylglutamate deiminase [Gammaproteobacteria bacterium]|nr:formimidoylglutamate deiminase [Gammaproteobacteria bacterium]
MTQTLWADCALTADGWQRDVRIDVNADGLISAISPNESTVESRYGLVAPALANLHSHAFQRAMAGMSEVRGTDSQESFWSWRTLLYRFLQHLSPDDLEVITAFAQMEMLESGYASVGEFHYLHHQVGGLPYDNVAEMSERIISAAQTTGIGLTLLPVLYEQGGCDGRALVNGQQRFGGSFDDYAHLYSVAEKQIRVFGRNANIGVAPHSLRAVRSSSFSQVVELAKGAPVHLHIAEQEAEVKEVESVLGSRPVQWLLDHQAVGNHWCLIHATHMNPNETTQLAKSGATVGLCPITESNLGDGIFDGKRYMDANGAWGIGTDSNIRISLSEELRTLEYSQRLRDRRRAVMANANESNGHRLYSSAAVGAAQALQRNTGSIAVGKQADLIALDVNSPTFLGVAENNWFDAWLFAGDDSLVTDVWSCGNHVVSFGRHTAHDSIESAYRNTLLSLKQRL